MSSLLRKTQKGFTLIELMIVVAIIGILAAIAIPNFLRFQLKSKTSEGKVNLAAIRTAEESFMAEYGSYSVAVASPAAYGGTQKIPFVDVGTAAAGNFATIGWLPEGNIFFNYAVAVDATNVLAYTVDAEADIDGNGTPQTWGYVHEDPSANVTVGSLGCVGIYDAAAKTNTLNNVVGPCGGTFGQSEF